MILEIMKFKAFVILITSFYSCSNQSEVLLQDSSKVEFISLPLRLNVLTAIDTEERFDRYSPNMKDTIYLPAKDVNFLLGGRSKSRGKIDMRIKATIVNRNGLQKKVFISRTGRLIFDGQIYEGSEQIRELIKKVDSLRFDDKQDHTW